MRISSFIYYTDDWYNSILLTPKAKQYKFYNLISGKVRLTQNIM